MSNIIDYLKKYGQTSFYESEFNELDAAVFARLSYIDFSDIINSRKYFSKKNLITSAKTILSLNEENRFKLKEDMLLLNQVALSSRYKDIKIKTYVKDTDVKIVKQFSAITFENIEKKNKFLIISFRGTDGTYTGWKEDFEMCYKDNIPAQQESKKYIHKITKFALRKPLYIVGHSKGGNLAIYSSAFSKRKNIKQIFTFDAPGFNKSFLSSQTFSSIKSKIIQFTPQASIIGRILYSDYLTKIVFSQKSLLNQHNLYNREIETNHFIEAKGYSFISNKIDQTIKSNLERMTYEEKVEFVESLFSVVKELTQDDVIQFGDSLISFILRFNKILKTKSKETKRLIYSIFKKDKSSEKSLKVEPIKNKKESRFATFFKRKDNKNDENELPLLEYDDLN